MSRPTVAHWLEVYLPRTQTFVHHLVAAASATRPVVFCDHRKNAEEFPAQVFERSTLRPRHPGVWFADRLLRLTSGRAFWFERLSVSQRVRLIHAHFGPNGCAALVLKRRTGLPLVTTFYGGDATSLPREPGWREAYAALFEQGDRFLVEGPVLGATLVGLGCPEAKITVQKIGVPLERIPYRRRNYTGGPKRLLFCGRLTEKKGVEYLLRALPAVTAAEPEVELRIVGAGPQEGRLRALAAELRLGSRAAFLGSVDYAAYLREIDQAHVLVQPSVEAADGDREGGAPTVILEAQAGGLPVVSTRHCDIPNVVDPGRSALLAGERDPEGLAAALIEMLRDPGRWPEFGAAGRAWVEREHSLTSQAAKLEGLYAAEGGW